MTAATAVIGCDSDIGGKIVVNVSESIKNRSFCSYFFAGWRLHDSPIEQRSFVSGVCNIIVECVILLHRTGQP